MLALEDFTNFPTLGPRASHGCLANPNFKCLAKAEGHPNPWFLSPERRFRRQPKPPFSSRTRSFGRGSKSLVFERRKISRSTLPPHISGRLRKRHSRPPRRGRGIYSQDTEGSIKGRSCKEWESGERLRKGTE